MCSYKYHKHRILLLGIIDAAFQAGAVNGCVRLRLLAYFQILFCWDYKQLYALHLVGLWRTILMLT